MRPILRCTVTETGAANAQTTDSRSSNSGLAGVLKVGSSSLISDGPVFRMGRATGAPEQLIPHLFVITDFSVL